MAMSSTISSTTNEALQRFTATMYGAEDKANTWLNELRYKETPEPVPNVTVEVKKPLKNMKRGKTAKDGLATDSIIDGANLIVVKLTELYTKSLQECSIPTAWKKYITRTVGYRNSWYTLLCKSAPSYTLTTTQPPPPSPSLWLVATKESNDQCVESNGQCVKSNGQCVKSNGHFVESNSQCVESNGHFVESNNQCVESNGQCVKSNDHFVESNSQCVESNGHFVEINGQCVESNSQFVESNDQFVESNGQCVESNGQCVESNDQCVESNDQFVESGFPLSPLTLVKLLNGKCDAGNGQFGTCMAKFECFKKGGSAYGICGQGFGVCCVITALENGVAFGNNTRIYKSEFNEGVHITYTILRMNSKVRQFRLDVKTLYMYEVEENGDCSHDYMEVNQDTKFEKVCGLSKDIHFYIDVTDAYAIFTFHTDPNKNQNRQWEIYVSQHTFDTSAPEGCGQWYRELSGKIGIWNNVDPSSTHWYYIDKQDYAICLRYEAGYCSFTYFETIAFKPKCSDYFERPGNPPSLKVACTTIPPSASQQYTVTGGLQYFFVEFEDASNKHVGSSSNPYRTPNIFFSQNKC
ncbi:uncharacterized protein [Palaemon carinicauda]|uniref:uncharacterized protein n=1 Tax=Palaemon carinicauda TaxID=392227 RepID=UPI0035B64ACA